MNVNFEKNGNVEGVLTITLEEKDYADKVKKQLKDISKTYTEKGFRPGHVPFGLIEKKFSSSVKYDVINKEVAETVYNYIKENNLPVLGQPVPEKNNDFKLENSDFTFKFNIGLAPEINPEVNSSIHIPYYSIIVTDDMVNDQIEDLRKRFGHQVPGEETDSNCVIKGEIVELNEDGTPKEEGIIVENGIIAPVHFKDENQKKLFDNKKPGDTVVFNPAATCDSNPVELSSMLNINKEEIGAHKGDFSFKIKEIIVLKPADLDQEFFDNAVGKDKAHNEDELKAALKELLAINLGNDSNYRFTVDAKDVIEKSVGKLELPDQILKTFLVNQGNGITAENVDEEYEKMRGQLTWDLIRDKIAEKFNIKVDREDLLSEARGLVLRQLMQYGANNLNDQIINSYAENVLNDEKNHDMLTQNALSRKVFETIKANVTLDKKEVSVEEFQQLFVPKA